MMTGLRRAGVLLIGLLVWLAPGQPAPAAAAGSRWLPPVPPRPVPVFYRASGIAAGPNGAIYVADEGAHQVDLLRLGMPPAALLQGESVFASNISGPRAVAAGPDGRVYVAGDGVLRYGGARRFLGRWTGGVLSYPRGLAVDEEGRVYVLSLHPVAGSARAGAVFDRITVTLMTPDGSTVHRWVFPYSAAADNLVQAASIAVTPAGALLLSIRAQRHCHDCDGTYYLLRTLTPTGAVQSTVTATAGGGSMAVAPSGTIYLAGSHQVTQLSPTGATLGTLGLPGCGDALIGENVQLAVDRSGTLLVTDTQTAPAHAGGYQPGYTVGLVHRFAGAGQVLPAVGSCPVPDTAPQIGQIDDLAAARDGTLFVADTTGSMIEHLRPDGTLLGTVPADHPSTVTVGADGRLYIPDFLHSALVERTLAGRFLRSEPVPMLDAVAVDHAGRIYGLDPFGRLFILPPLGQGTRPLRSWFIRGYGRAGSGLDPEGIALDRQGNIWVVDPRHNNLQKWSPTGRLLLIKGRAGNGPGEFHTPDHLAIDRSDHVWVSDLRNNRVQEFDLRMHFVAAYGRDGMAAGQFESPTGIAAAPDGRVYVGDRGNDRIQVLQTG